ncbi:unnamed protein product [marine sediment metagenome]|uniref:Uncharacterized protein n=1 Tax=marine sediment metagenome TaxID=412755 RepID=X1KTE9_9ZZZZ
MNDHGKYFEDIEKDAELVEFYKNAHFFEDISSIDLEPEFSEVLVDNFWELL